MGSADDKSSRSTVELDREVLAKLTREARDEPARADLDVDVDPDSVETVVEPAASRTATVHDPMTMALLAEVARSSRTVELDADTIDEANTATPDPGAQPQSGRRDS